MKRGPAMSDNPEDENVKREHSARYEKGWAALQEIHGSTGMAVIEELKKTAPEMAACVIEYAFADHYSRPGLDLRTRELCTIASLVTQGGAERELKAHILAALKAGATKQEVTELMLQMTIYAGFPKALNSMRVAVEAFEEG